MDSRVFFKLSYGLYLLSAQKDGKDNACIVNTVVQQTSSPACLSVTVNRDNLTRDMIAETGMFQVSVLDSRVPFSVFQRFGFQSGRVVDKFAGFSQAARSEQGLLYLTDYANASLFCRVVEQRELGTHTLFLAAVEDAAILSEEPSVTYADYHSRIKPRAPEPTSGGKPAWRCQICSYVHEGADLPADFICPICKHGASDFEKVVLN